jgi:signal transduction histidine kinase
MAVEDAHEVRADEERLLDAILTVVSDLELSGVLRRIIEAACALTDAHYGALGVIDREGTALSEFVTHGLTAEQEALIGPRPTGKGVLGVLLTDPKPIRLDDISAHPRSYGFPPNHPPMRSFLGVPIRVRGLVYGNLYLTEKRGGAEFTDRDERLVSSLAAAAGVTIDNARLQAHLSEMALYSDRERIARDLHDTVIQRLFAIGLGLQGLARIVDPPEAAQRIEAAVDDIDATIADIRATIFSLQVRAESGLRARVFSTVTDARDALGFLPRVVFDGPVDASTSEALGEEVISIVREALSNIARHARATQAEVSLSVSAGELRATISDDGIGIRSSAGPSGSGLRNMAARAERLGGSFDVRSRPGEGTSVTWTVPVAS